jgi:hypothetical protein
VPGNPNKCFLLARYRILGHCFNLPPHLHLPRMEKTGLE